MTIFTPREPSQRPKPEQLTFKKMDHFTIVFVVFTLLSLHFEGSSCRFRGQTASDSEQILVESFKKKLLKELGFSTAPNVSGLRPPKIPEILRNLVEAENRKFKRMAEEVDDKFYAKTRQIFLLPEEGEIYFLFCVN